MPTSNAALLAWVEQTRELCKPTKVHWCTGSDEEQRALCSQLVEAGTFVKLNEKLRPNSYLARSDARDVDLLAAKSTYVCSKKREDAGPTNNWADPVDMKKKMNNFFGGCMKGRTMYVAAFCLGPQGSARTRFGVQITDSPYVVVNLKLLSRGMGSKALGEIGADKSFLPCLHSVGQPLGPGEKDVSWPCNPSKAHLVFFPDDPSIMSFGSSYGGNAFLNLQCALRLATPLARKVGTKLAEHCTVIKVVSPSKKKHYICAILPTGCNVNLSTLIPTLPGWSVRCVGDYAGWLHIGEDGRLYCSSPVSGFYGTVAGNSYFNNRGLMDTLRSNSIFTNVALTSEGDVWWEGLTKGAPSTLTDWNGDKWTPTSGRSAAHPNAHFTVAAQQCPVVDFSDWENADGVPISAFLFGFQRSHLVPITYEALSWEHGVFVGSTLSVQRGEDAADVRYDSFAMADNCGYNIADYLSYWAGFRKNLGWNSPRIFFFNTGRKGENNEPLWPGYGENSRILKWIFERIEGQDKARRTPIGYVPTFRGFDTSGLDIQHPAVHSLLQVEASEWLEEVARIKKHLSVFGNKIPSLQNQLSQLEKRLQVEEHQPPTHNAKLLSWVEEVRLLCRPEKVHWCTGSEYEYDELCTQLVESGTFTPLNPKLRPNSYLARSDPRDVARVESCTFICSKDKTDAGPTNNWADPNEMRKKLNALFDGCMKGRTMYIIPFCMGPLGSPYSKYGVEISDSPYVVVNMRIMTRIGTPVLTLMGDSWFLPCLHSVGHPLEEGQKDVPWPCNAENRYIVHFTEEDNLGVMSFGSGYGGNALLGKKCYALRIASVLARKEGWLAEHNLILGLTSPEGKKYYICAGFPSACGKTNLAMLVPTIPGWTVRCVGDDIAWLHIGEDGQLYGINPESGFFGVAPGTSNVSNRSAMIAMQKNTIFTNVGLTPDGDVWWEGMTKEPPTECIDWLGEKWVPGCGKKVAHPNARYTTPASQCPVIDPAWDDPNGVPICALIFGGRRPRLIPLVTEAFSWTHGVFMGSIISSELTAAAEGTIGDVRRDPFAMLPFCGYNMADYFNHWVEFRNKLGYNSPKIFYVNWFRTDESGRFMWPGFGENSRVLKWICERIGSNPTGKSVLTAIGHTPSVEGLDTGGLDISNETVHKLLHVDAAQWLEELEDIKKHFAKFGDRMPTPLLEELSDLEKRLHLLEVEPPTTNKKLLSWVEEVRKLCKPEKLHWCTGTDDEYDEMCQQLVKSGTFTKLNEKLRPNSFLARSDPRDVARVESCTFICSKKKEDAGPTNNWADPDEMKEKLNKMFNGCMKGRTMYIVPFCMGPVGSPYSKYGIEITDSPYVVVNMKIMTRIGTRVLQTIGDEGFFLPCLHSVGYPLIDGRKDVAWPCDPENRYIVHFTEEPLGVMSYGSGYGGNALLGKKCYALRIASVMGRKEGWLAEHNLLLGLTSPEGKQYYIAAGFPSACGKTNLAMLVPTIPGWTVRCVGDDIAWLHVGDDGRLYGINPEAGFFGVAPGTSNTSNRSAMLTMQKNSIFTNVALTPEGDVWWEGMTKDPPSECIDWLGDKWTPNCGKKAAHPNSRYTTPASQCPVIDPNWENPDGVPICAFIFGGRRPRLVPLVTEAFVWDHGVFMGSIISSELTAAAEGTIGDVRRDPFAMIPFCGYNMADYFAHWIQFKKKLGYLAPKIFYVNWFRTDEKGKFLWPGFGENSRVLKWICERVDGMGHARSTPIGYVPTYDAIDTGGLDISNETMHQLLHVDSDLWLKEIPDIQKFHAQFGDRLPPAIRYHLNGLESRLRAAHDAPTQNKKILAWVDEIRQLCKPAAIQWCNGSDSEFEELCDDMVKTGTLSRLNDDLRPKSFVARSDPRDTIRVSKSVFICTDNKEDVGPTNNWADPKERKDKMNQLFDGCMTGRKMYVVPFCLGPIGSPYSRFGVEITDSPYAVAGIRVMTRMGTRALNLMNEEQTFLRSLHSVGAPLAAGQKDVPWPCNIENRSIAHFIKEQEIYSFGSGYGANSIISKSCYALRVASALAKDEGWLVAHSLILALTSPEGKKYYICAVLPGGCGKTSLAMLVPSIPGWTLRCVGDDIAWLHVGDDGKLYAINPEAGFYDIPTGRSLIHDRGIMATVQSNTIFSNVATTPDGDVWWEGLTKTPPAELIDWQGEKWNPSSGKPAAHPNARYLTPQSNCPVLDPEAKNPIGVPISAFVFGSRRKTTYPLVHEVFSWEHGALMAASTSVDHLPEGLKYDPLAMRSYCGYNIGDYLSTWANFRTRLGYNTPKIFYTNWFREDADGKMLWPGFEENSRVLKWICERIEGTGKVHKTSIGYVPSEDGLDVMGLDISKKDLDALFEVNPDEWIKELANIKSFYESLGDTLPPLLKDQLKALEDRLKQSSA